jgi:hypothetical protein
MKKKYLLFFLSVFLIVLILLFLLRRPIMRKWHDLFGNNKGQMDSSCPKCGQLFTDGVAVQNQAYLRSEIQPQENFDDLYLLEEKGMLKEVKSGEDFTIDDLDFSVPLLDPKAIRFLDVLSERYRNECLQSNLNYAPFSISSLTRSIESSRKLQEKNGNAIENSGHLRGKTFDISYITPKKESAQKKLFIKTLSALRREGHCYVKYEMNQKCLHITVR